jgi:tetratricopeptide (TPR) repeat protein
MRRGGSRESGLGLVLLAVVLAGFSPELKGSPLGDAEAFYKQKRYPEAKALLEPLSASEPSNPAAAYFLGMTLLRTGGPTALDSAHQWLGRAVKLAPENAGYLAEYSGVCLLMADRDNSFSLALEGRDGMTRAIEGNPDDLEAREGLMRFYAKAPWPLGDPAKALLMAAEIAKRDPKRGSAAYLSIAATFDRQGRKQEALSASQAAQNLAPAHRE